MMVSFVSWYFWHTAYLSRGTTMVLHMRTSSRFRWWCKWKIFNERVINLMFFDHGHCMWDKMVLYYTMSRCRIRFGNVTWQGDDPLKWHERGAFVVVVLDLKWSNRVSVKMEAKWLLSAWLTQPIVFTIQSRSCLLLQHARSHRV